MPACLALLTQVLAGCKVGPDYGGPPRVCVHSSWRHLGDATLRDDCRPLTDWWTAFEDPVLNDLIARAVAQNLDLREAALRIFEARAQRCTVRADLCPQIAHDASYSYTKFAQSGGMFGVLGGAGGPTFNIDTASDQWSFGLNGTWEIDVFGRLRRLVEAADADIAVSVEDYRDTLVVLLADVAGNYVDARSFQHRAEISRKNLETQLETLRKTEKRFPELSPELDVVQARANAESTAAGIPSLETGYQQALNRLSVLLGCPPGEVDRLLADPLPIPTARDEIAIGIPADLLRRRPDIRRAERELAAQTARIGAAVGEMYPKFSILGSFGLDAQDFRKLFNAGAIGASVGPNMNWNILNFGKLRCNVYVQEARQGQRAVQYQSAVLRAAEEVDNALVSYVREQQRLKHLTNEATANKRAVELSEKRYIGGDVSFLRVLDSQRSLLLSEDQLVTSQANVAASLIQLNRALGGGWELSANVAAAPIEPLVVPLPATEPAPEVIETPMPALRTE
jgi:NodT family efflux transporter outer membrane factor (OMF) lipoprotein